MIQCQCCPAVTRPWYSRTWWFCQLILHLTLVLHGCGGSKLSLLLRHNGLVALQSELRNEDSKHIVCCRCLLKLIVLHQMTTLVHKLIGYDLNTEWRACLPIEDLWLILTYLLSLWLVGCRSMRLSWLWLNGRRTLRLYSSWWRPIFVQFLQRCRLPVECLDDASEGR